MAVAVANGAANAVAKAVSDCGVRCEIWYGMPGRQRRSGQSLVDADRAASWGSWLNLPSEARVSAQTLFTSASAIAAADFVNVLNFTQQKQITVKSLHEHDIHDIAVVQQAAPVAKHSPHLLIAYLLAIY